ncbi:MAG TPA: leucyl aminopeptidase [Spongiibacteraceae bacterium]|nr:leucyl aminopeptidase [Spongiibacteraceae bacterium]
MLISGKNLSHPEQQRSQCLIVGVPAKGNLRGAAKRLDSAADNLISRLQKRGDIKGDWAQTLMLPTVAGIAAERILLVGIGSGSASDVEYRKLIQAVLGGLAEHKVEDACWLLEPIAVKDRDAQWPLLQLALAATLREYRYTETLSKPKPPPTLKKLIVADASSALDKQALLRGAAIGRGMNVARRLGDLPGNICTPTLLAKEARAIAGKHAKASIKVLEEKAMRELGMGALLSVAAGSEQPAKLIVLEYRGGRRSEQPQVLVGKGITFDSGGISLKPGAKMDEMKFDMCGAASVLGTLHAVIELNLPINVVAIIAASENMPSGAATKPGDVVTSMSGQTIEILNTDAEGRLVLCDALTYAARFKPAAVIDIATLTGACVVALGKHASGLFSNQDDFAEQLLAAGRTIGDRAWQLPLWDDYQKQLDSNFADMGNIGGAGGGSITAACFLARFAKGYRWAHLDIAGTAWDEGGAKGATGRPVGLLMQYLIERS